MNAYGTTYTIAADFNNDGYLDLATVEAQGKEIHIIVYSPTLGCYQQIASYPTGNSPAGIIVADFNSDGNVDIAVPSAGSNTVTILLGNGDGTFTASTVTAGSVNTSLVSADFNGDGVPDLAVADLFYGTVAILLGKGDGTFTAAPSLSASDAESVVAGDFNGDGKLDLAVAVNEGIAVFTGNGDGTFNSAPTVTIPSTADIWRLAAGDFNGDGKLDLVLGSGVNVLPSAGQIMVLLGNGDGTFSAAAPSATAEAPVQLAVADFNLDGNADIAALDSAGDITVLAGRGDGTFTSPPYIATNLESIFSQGFAIGDMDGDGRPDIIFSGSYPPNKIVIYFGLTKPMQTASTSPVAIDPPGAGQHLVVANYPGDANATAEISDPVTLLGTPPATTTTLSLTANGSPATTVSSGTVVTLAASVVSGGTALTTGQINFCEATAPLCSDIHLLGTAALTSSGNAVLKLLPAPGDHSYKAVLAQNDYGATSQSGAVPLTVTPPAVIPIQTTTTIAQSGSFGNYTLTATVNETGNPTAPTGTVSFLDTNYSNQSLATAQLGSAVAGLDFPIAYSYPVSNVGYMLQASGDFNGDGRQDIAAINSGAEAIDILLSNGDGTFTSAAGIPLTIHPYAIAVGDFNQDGKLDIVVATPQTAITSPAQLLIFLGNGDGTFRAAGGKTYPDAANSIFVADLNGDGKPDLVISAYYNTAILLGNGDGTFANPVAVGSSGAIAVGDFNGDGIPDLILGYNTSNQPVYLGNGDGTFSPNGFAFTGITGAGPTVVADFNGDGIPDVGIAALYYSAVNIFLGKGDGTFTAVDASANPSINEPSSIAVADLNGDGNADLIVTNVNSYSGNTMNPDLTFMLGNGDGTFTAITGDTQLNGTWSVLAADFNGDGRPDLAVGTGAGISVLLTQPTQTATATATGVAPSGAGPHLVDASYPGDANFKSSLSDTTSLLVQAPSPVITPASGTYTTIQSVTITDSIPGATIYYTTDGSTPIVNPAFYQTASPIYTGPITVQSYSETISAIAVATGYQPSTTTQTIYTLNLPSPVAPVLSLAPGYYASAQTLTIMDATPGTTIYYTTNGTTPTTGSIQYTGPIAVTSSETVMAIAVYGYAYSPTISGQYFIGGTTSSFIYTVAGNASFGYSGDGGPATAASLNNPVSVAVDSTGNLYLADTANNVIRRVDAKTGLITTIAGDGTPTLGGDNGPATSAQVGDPIGLAVDGQGNIYVSEPGLGVVRKIAAGTGIITTYAGNPTATSTGDGGPATSALLSNPQGLALDANGNLYITSGFVVRRVDLGTGTITTYAGNGAYGYTGDSGPAANATFEQPVAISFDKAGNLYIADSGAGVVREVATGTTTVTTIAGKLSYQNPNGAIGDGGAATSSYLSRPGGVAVDGSGNVYIADSGDNEVRIVNAQTGIINAFAGNANLYCAGIEGDGGTAIAATVCEPEGIAFDASGNLYIAESNDARIRLVTGPVLTPSTAAPAPVFSVAAGTYVNPQSVGITDSIVGSAIHLTLDGTAPSSFGNTYRGTIAVTGSVTIEAMAIAPGYLPSAVVEAAYTIATPPAMVIKTIAGNGSPLAPASGRPATTTAIGSVAWVKADATGNLYFTSQYGSFVKRFDHASGVITVIAGGGTYGTGCSGEAATSAYLGDLAGIAIDVNGNIFLSLDYPGLVCRIDAVTGNITAYAGGGEFGYPNIGDGGPATSAYLATPQGLAVDGAGNLFIADENSRRIRRVDAKTGTISTVAGGGTAYPGDGGQATSAELISPRDLALDGSGNLYIADVNGRVRFVSASTGTISTVAGNGVAGGSGDGLTATNAEIEPVNIALDSAGNIYIADWSESSVRMIPASGGAITAFAGVGYLGFSGDGGAPSIAELYAPEGLTFDGAGNLYIADMYNFRIREVSAQPAAATPTFSLAAGSYKGAQSLTITDTAPNAIVYYTSDGSTPNAGSTQYSGAITISQSETIRAIAVAPGFASSAVASATYTIVLPTPTLTWLTPAAITYGTALSATQLDAADTVAGTFVYTPPGGTVLTAGPQALSVTFTPNDTTDYTTATTTVTLMVSAATPAITWTTPAAITYGTALSATQLDATSTVAGSFAYTPAIGTLLSAGTQTLKTTFTPTDAVDFTTATDTVRVTVNKAVPTVTATPSSAKITNEQNDTVSITVAGTGSVPPSGTVTLSSGSYSAQQTLSAGNASFNIPAGTLNNGANTLTAAYSGDASFENSNGTASITVSQMVMTVPSPSAVNPGATATATVTLSASSTYSGTMNMACTLTASPAGAQDLPTCSLSPSSITLAAGGSGNTQLTVTTTASSVSSLARPSGQNFWRLGGGTVLAALMLFVFPAKRRRWLSMMALLAVVAIAGVLGCGGGQSSPPPVTNPGTTAGTYTFSVTGTDSANSTITTSTSVKITVQ
jgi:sugar lactone lactonase YvrE